MIIFASYNIHLSAGGDIIIKADYGSQVKHIPSVAKAAEEDIEIAKSAKAEKSPLVPSIAGYYTPDGFRHAITATVAGELNDIFFNPQRGEGIERLAYFDAIKSINGFFTTDDGYQHEIITTPDDNIHDIFFKPNDIHISDPLASFKGIIGTAAFYAEDDTNRIVIVATGDGNIHEIFYNPNIGVHISHPPLANFDGIVGIAAFYTPDDKFRHVIVATDDGNVHEMFYHPTIGVHISEPPLANFKEIIGTAAFYAEDDTNRIVIVATGDGNIHEIFYNPNIGVHISHPPLANFDGIVGIAAFYTPDDKFRHVIVATDDGNVHEMFYHPTIGVHISEPPLANFTHKPALEDISPDPGNVDQATLDNFGSDSTSGRILGVAGYHGILYALTHHAGVWRTVGADVNPWKQLAGSPQVSSSRYDLRQGPNIATDPRNEFHLVAGNESGAWESLDRGDSWTQVLKPTSMGCSSDQVSAVIFDASSQLFLGADCGIIFRDAPSNPFQLKKFPPDLGAVTAFAVSQTKIWTRTANALFVSTDNGVVWSAPIAVPNNIQFRPHEVFTLGAFDNFAYMVSGMPDPANPKSTDNLLVVFNSDDGSWKTQPVIFNGDTTGDGTGSSGVVGRKFVKTFIRNDSNLVMMVGEMDRLQLFYCAGQDIYQALGLNNDGTVTSWKSVLSTKDYGGKDLVHSDIWDFLIDVSVRGRTAWVAGDGGIYFFTDESPYSFTGKGWAPHLQGLHTHQVNFTVTVLNINPISRSRLAYPTADNSAWIRDTSPVVMPDPLWEVRGYLGDGNFTAGDPSCPDYVLLARQRDTAVFEQYGVNFQDIALLNYKKNMLTIGPDTQLQFQFIPSPKSDGRFTTVDAVMLVDLPLTDGDGVPFFPPDHPLGQNSNGAPVLIRNRNFELNPDINTSKGNGWTLEIPSFPQGTEGFYVTGNRLDPLYYALAGNTLLRLNGNQWVSVATGLVRSQHFGPAFVNPWDRNVLYVLTATKGVQVSTDGSSFSTDTVLTALVAGAQNLPMSTVSQIAFNYDNPSERVCGAQSGVFFSSGNGEWKDLTPLLPSPRTPVTAVGIDCEGIYIATDGRSILRIANYK